MGRIQGLIKELHRRSVWQVLAIYLAGSWIALQVVETLVETLELPEWAPGLAFTLLVVGLPIVLATAFVQEGRGFGFEDDEPGPGSSATGRADPDPNLEFGSKESLEAALSLFTWRNAIGGGIAAFALWGVMSAGWIFFGPGFDGVNREANPSAGVETGSAEAVRTIAVLPFANMSGTDEAEPFTVGIHDDILTQLSKIGALQVTSRTSVLDYRDSPKAIGEIADELGVETILEGGVQSAANRVRINVQLIDAGSDRHLWAETYDRELTAENVFDIQSEIARNVADALRAELAPGEEAAIATIPTTDLEALALYHRGRELFADRTDPVAASEAENVLEQAVRLDPRFAAAWAELARTRSWLLGYGSDDWDGTEEALGQATALAPGSFETEMGEGYYRYYGQRDYGSALDRFTAAGRLRPTDVDAIQARSLILRRLGRWDESVELLEQAAALDPRNVDVFRQLGETYGMMRRFGSALARFETAVELRPADLNLAGEYATLALTADDSSRAAVLIDSYRLADETDVIAATTAVAAMEWARRDFDAAVAAWSAVSPLETPVAESFRLYFVGIGLLWAGRSQDAVAYGDSVEALVTDLAGIPLAGWRESLLSGAFLLQDRMEEARSMARDCIREGEATGDQVDGVLIMTLCSFVLGSAGAPDEAIDRLLDMVDLPSRDFSVGALHYSPWLRDALGDHPRFPDLLDALESVEREAAARDGEAR